MAIKLGVEDETKVAILIGDEEVTAVFPPQGDAELNEAIKKLATSRQSVNRGGNVKDTSFEARLRFFNTQCRRIENVEGPDGKPLCGEPGGSNTPDWRKMVPPNWKVSFALFFEEKATLSAADVGN